MLETSRLLTFATVVRTGSFAGAARELGYTQPGISQQMRALEREFDAALFTRVGRGVQLSEEGRVLATRVEPLLEEIRSTEERVRTVTRLRQGRVRIFAFASANATLVPDATSKLRDAQIDIDIEIVEADPTTSLVALQKGDADVAVAFEFGEIGVLATEETFSIPLMKEQLLLLAPEGHPVLREESVELAHLAEERWIAPCPRCRHGFVSACEDSGFTPRIDVSTDDTLAVQSHVVAGLGLAVMPEMVQSFVRHPKLRSRPLSPPRFRSLSAIVLRTNNESQAIKHVVSALRWAAERLSNP